MAFATAPLPRCSGGITHARGTNGAHCSRRGAAMIGERVAVGFLCLVLLAGCASAHAIPVKRADGPLPCQMSVPQRDLLFGVALSGGGSRAALFGASGLEALARVATADGASVIDKITHVSSVSGGSIAATYYTLKKP